MAQNFFAFNPENIHSIREKMLYLVKWGFPYKDVRNIPIDEVDEYIENINEYYKRKNAAVTNPGSADIPENPNPIGKINPAQFK